GHGHRRHSPGAVPPDGHGARQPFGLRTGARRHPHRQPGDHGAGGSGAGTRRLRNRHGPDPYEWRARQPGRSARPRHAGGVVMPEKPVEAGFKTALDVDRYIRRMADTSPLMEYGLVEKMVANTIESHGPNVTMGSLCYLRQGRQRFPVEVIGFNDGR